MASPQPHIPADRDAPAGDDPAVPCEPRPGAQRSDRGPALLMLLAAALVIALILVL